MSESMIEHVARAIARTQSGTLFREECTAVQLDAFGYVAAARAAIEAMREPTDAMIDAAYDRLSDTAPLIGKGTADPEGIFKAMIDVALNEDAA